MSRFLVLTGTTGFPLIEQGICRLHAPQHSFLLQTKNKVDIPNGANVAHVDFLDMSKIDCSEYDAVIGHCGAGTVFWVLENNLPLLAVIDLDRPDDHQSDLGGWLEKHRFAYILKNRAPELFDLDEVTNRSLRQYNADLFNYEKIGELIK